MTKAPTVPSRHSLIRKERGDRQPFKHARLSGVHWKTPAAKSSPPLKTGLVAAIVGDRSAVLCNHHWASVAEYAVQTARYPATKCRLARTPPGGLAALVHAEKSETIGAAEGTIMAIIITAHITKSRKTAPHSGTRHIIPTCPSRHIHTGHVHV
jgi:hypothetical protein